MKLLLHICCGPCAVACVESLKDEGADPTGFWFNPNIHPFTEYKSRRDSLLNYVEAAGLDLHMEDAYGLRSFLRATSHEPDKRCDYCYAVRMDRTAAFAAREGFDAFSTTLLISPYQNHGLLLKSAEKAARLHGVQFLYRDFRPLFRQGQQKARDMGLYMQKYCGCVYSEEERYIKKDSIR